MAAEQDRERLKELRLRLERLRKVKAVNGVYKFENKDYTEKGFADQISKAENEIAKLEKALRPSEMEVAAAESAKQRDITSQAQKIQLDLNSVASRRKDLERAALNATTVQERDNLQTWITLFKANEARLQAALNDVQAGKLGVVVPQPIDLVKVDTARKQPAPGPAVPTTPVQPVAPAQGGLTAEVQLPAGIDFAALGGATPASTVAPVQGVFGGQTVPPLIAAPKQTETTTETPTTPAKTPATPTTPSVPGVPAPDGSVTGINPATGETVTLPAGIDFAWLASQTPSTPPAWEQAAIELYGGYYEVIKNIPELRGLIGRAMTGGWSEDKFQYELEQTTWWRTTTASARAWEEQKVRDPASLQTLIDNKTAAIRDEALTLGIRIDDASLSKLAEDSLKFGWSDQVLTNAVGMEALKSQAGVSQLRQGYYGQSIKSIASNYGVPLSDTVTNQWIAKIASGQENEASFQAYVRDLSKNLYPALSSGFDRGLTFGQMTSPYAQYASNILEIPEAQVDFTDPKWAAAFTMKDAKGQQTQMSFGEWADYLRTNPAFGYEYTDGAQQKAYQVANQLARLFGAA